MATMLPDVPRECTQNSLEELMFESLKKLPDDYYVFHSFTIVKVTDGVIRESETDFVIFNPNMGIMCIEAKAGTVKYENAEWYYGSGIKMRHGGPYLQAETNKYKLIQYIRDKGLDDILNRCKITHAVWFPSVSEDLLREIELPSDGAFEITLTSNDLKNPEEKIRKIFSYRINSNYDVNTNLEAYEVRNLIKSVLCPSFELVPSISNQLDQNRLVFNRLLSEQSRILDFLEEQKSAAISGIAGSGKTMIAMEKARRNSELNEKTLFLCYNRNLCDYLRNNYKYAEVDIYTIDGFACKICNSESSDMQRLSEELEKEFFNGAFPYKHVIIDEGQDFGQTYLLENSILDLLQTIVLDESIDGTFYIFYDKMQLVQGHKIPECISEADCKMTLHYNCRNTENIAITSVRPLKEEKYIKCIKGPIKGDSSIVYIDDKEQKLKEYLDATIDDFIEKGINDIVILTCKTEESSYIHSYIRKQHYNAIGRNIRFSSCRKYKGLEADAIILIDIDKNTFISKDVNLFYVGSSRARFYLTMLIQLSEAECNETLLYFNKNENKRPKKALAAYLNAKLRS